METHYLRPSGPSASSAETFRLSTADHVVTQHYSVWAIIFKLGGEDPAVIIRGFKKALEMTLGQCRHFVGRVEVNEHGDFSIVKKPFSTVRLNVRRLNGAHDTCPSFDQMESEGFTSQALGDPASITIEGMTMASERHPSTSPEVSGFQLTFVRGGCILAVHRHHLVCDVSGLTSLVRQIAGNCRAVFANAELPDWDDAWMDRSRFITPTVADVDQVQPPEAPQRHPDWLPCSWLLFHINQANVAELKQLATPDDGTWISTYDAIVAFLWRIITKNRADIYKPDLSAPAIFMVSVNMRNRLNPPVHERYQGNLVCGGLSFRQGNVPTLADVISDAPLSRLAAFIRKVTQSVTSQTMDDMLESAAPIKDKSTLHVRLDSVPPMSLAATDWRKVLICDEDFGIGRPAAARFVADTVFENMVTLYPSRTLQSTNGSNTGVEVVVPFENHAVDKLIGDDEMRKFFEFKSVEARGS
ncbi:transferase family-domain-containing protein [Hypoxylon sp. NC1633]|nr:transferase family-domain-containing protein [Hypoxylon sp. NC1633]